MVVETRYVPGTGALVGSGALWALFSDPADDRVLEDVWQITAHASTDPTACERVVRAVENAFGGAPVALVVIDLRNPVARVLTRGTGSATDDGQAHVLTLGTEPPPATSGDFGRRLASGVVAASAARINPMNAAGAPGASAEADVPAAGPGLIDGVPAAILAARGPDGPPPPRPRLDPATLAPPTDMPLAHPEHHRADPHQHDLQADEQPGADPSESEAPTGGPADAALPEPYDAPAVALGEAADGAGSAPDYPTLGTTWSDEELDPLPAAPETTAARLARLEHEASPAEPDWDDHDGSTVHRPAGHLAAQEATAVLAVYCPLGHPSSPALPACRTCHQRIAPQEPRSIPRPPLGGLRLPTGEVVPLDRGVVVGRKPAPVPGSSDWPHLVHLPSDHAFVSRMHLQIELHGWDVIARDLGSRGGTTLTYPGRPPMPMRGGEAYVLAPGTVLDLAEVYAVRFETGAGVQ